MRLSHTLKGAVEADVKFQMDIDHQISPTEKAGAMRLIELPHS